MKLSLRDAPLPTDACPTERRVSAAIVWCSVMRAISEFGFVDEHGKTTAIGRHAPQLGRRGLNCPRIGWGSPVEGQAPIGPTKPLPTAEALIGRPLRLVPARSAGLLRHQAEP